MKLVGQYIRGLTSAGRLHFQMRYIARSRPALDDGILRWDRQSSPIDSLGVVRMPAATRWSAAAPRTAPVMGIMPFTAADAWTVAPDGRIAMIALSPYRVDWLAPGRRRVVAGLPSPSPSARNRRGQAGA
ncbi:MAG: hypothetical protein IPO52_10390 [Gemmatimonadetes bacterium]|nr:hypothetical protein [Gemmatimonadota bacterium]